MNILMTGGSGLIGRHFIDHFSQHRYTVLTRSESRARPLLPANVELVGSLSGFSHLNAFDAVINLAGEPIVDKRWTRQQKQTICQSRWQITRELVHLMQQSDTPPPVFLSGSAVGIYGDCGSTTVTEESRIEAQDFAHQVCQEWENIALNAPQATRTVLLRTGVVLDTKAGALAKMRLPFKLGLGGKLGGGQQFFPWIHWLDQVRAMHYLLTESSLSGALNLTAPEPVSNQHFSQRLAARLHRPALMPMPALALKMAMGESSSLLLNSQKILPKRLLDAGFKYTFATLDAALNDLI